MSISKRSLFFSPLMPLMPSMNEDSRCDESGLKTVPYCKFGYELLNASKYQG